MIWFFCRHFSQLYNKYVSNSWFIGNFFDCLATKRIRPYPLGLRIVQLLIDPRLQILIYHCLPSLHTEVAVQKVTGVEEHKLYEGSDHFLYTNSQHNCSTVLKTKLWLNLVPVVLCKLQNSTSWISYYCS